MNRKHTALIVVIFLIVLTSNSLAIDGRMSGAIGSRIRYTPELGFEAAYFLTVRNGFTKQATPYSSRVVLASMWPKAGHFREEYWTPRYNVPYPYVSEIFFKTKKPLWNGSSLLTIGDEKTNYSPYIVNSGAANRRGIHFHDFQFGEYKSDAFLFFKGKMSNPVYGMQINRKYNTYHLKGILMDLKDQDSGNELAGSLEIEVPSNFGKTNGIFALLKKGDETFKLGEVSLQTMLGNTVQINTVLRDFEPGFRPYYATKTNADKPNALNPIDKYYGLKGISIELDTRIAGSRINLAKDISVNRDYLRNLTYVNALENIETVAISGRFLGINANLKYQNRTAVLEGFDNNNLITGSSSWVQLRKQKATNTFIFGADFLYWNDLGTPLLDVNNQVARIVNENGKEFGLSAQVRKGIFNGFKFLAGLKIIDDKDDINEAILYKTIGFDYQTLTGIQVVCRYTTPNLEEPDDFRIPTGKRPRNAFDLYDRFGRKVEIDNIIEIRFRTSY